MLGHDPAPYDELAAKVRDAFNRAYVSADGTVKGDTQTVYVLALSIRPSFEGTVGFSRWGHRILETEPRSGGLRCVVGGGR